MYSNIKVSVMYSVLCEMGYCERRHVPDANGWTPLIANCSPSLRRIEVASQYRGMPKDSGDGETFSFSFATECKSISEICSGRLEHSSVRLLEN